MLRRVIALSLALVFVFASAGPAVAHGRSGEADVRFAQTIAGMELTIVVRASIRVPAPLQVDVVAHDPGEGGPVELAIRPAEGGRSSTGRVRVEQGRPGMYPALLSVDRVGLHELEVRAGGQRSLLPFMVLVPRAPLWEVVMYAALACAAMALIGALVAAPMLGRVVAVSFAGVFAVATVVAFTVGALSPWFVLTTPEGAPPAPSKGLTVGRPNGQPVIRVDPERPSSGSTFTLRVELFDGSSGYPVDDLVEHHAALSHVVVTNQDGAYFRHVHPIRTAPGTFEVRLRAQARGLHKVYVEFERADSGGQVVTGEFTVGNGGWAASRLSAAAGSGWDVLVTEPAQPVAGRPVRIALDTGRTGLQPWLGMAGHLIVRSQDGGYLGHVHEARSMVTGAERVPDESVTSYGPELVFAFSFPRPGRYLTWIQYAKDYRIVTVPHVVEVAEERR